eukprot:12047903-Ditylum_brightwellii.AAC.1
MSTSMKCDANECNGPKTMRPEKKAKQERTSENIEAEIRELKERLAQLESELENKKQKEDSSSLEQERQHEKENDNSTDNHN